METTLHGRLRLAVAKLPEELRGPALNDLAELEHHGVVDREALARLVVGSSEPAHLRAIGAWAMGLLQEPASSPHLEDVIQRQDTSEALLWEATKALSKLGRGAALFRRLLLDGQAVQVRKAAAYALGCLQDQQATADLCRVLNSASEEPAVRGQAAEALGYLRDRSAFTSLIEAASDPSPEVRYWVAFALGQLGDRRAEPVLDQLSQGDSAQVEGWGTVAEEAGRALEELRGPG